MIFTAIIAILLVIIIYNISYKNELKDMFRVKARAFYSCKPPKDCAKTRIISDKQLLTINPFVWPYDGVFSQQEIITGTKPPAIILDYSDDDPGQTALTSEPDHIPSV